jgi:hypothetical protein
VLRHVEEVPVGDQQTCGEGLADNAVLPRQLGAVGTAMADVLGYHMRALDLTDPDANAEHDAYASIVDALQSSAAELRSTAEQMARCGELPMGRHDAGVMASPDALHAFEQLVRAKQALHALLARQAAQDAEMLTRMRRAVASAS